MKHIFLFMVLTMTNIFPVHAEGSFNEALYELTLQDISGNDVSLADYRGYVLLIVNTASRCGFTSQYKGLELLYKTYADKKFAVLAFPSNDFGSQEPGSNADIAYFCEQKFNVSFPMFAKSHVKNEPINPLYRLLTQDSPKVFQGSVGWNFVKFLINREGELVGRYPSIKKPAKLSTEIEKYL